MEKFTKEFYLENRKKTKFEKQILFFGNDTKYQFDDLISKLTKWKQEELYQVFKEVNQEKFYGQ